MPFRSAVHAAEQSEGVKTAGTENGMACSSCKLQIELTDTIKGGWTMLKKGLGVAVALSVGIIAGCSGSGGSTSQTVPVNGIVADGYLKGAEVFMDKHGNYQWDGVEPRTISGAGGTYTLNVSPQDMGKYPIVVKAIPGSTIDEDDGQPVRQGYVMTAPAGVTGFVSPMSSVIRGKMVFGNYSSTQRAMNEMRQQFNLNANINMLGNYMDVPSTDPKYQQYQQMRTMAKNMASLIGNQLNMGSDNSINPVRYMALMGNINANLPQMWQDMMSGMGMTAFMQKYDFTPFMMNIPGSASGSGFTNMSSVFKNMSSHTFWNISGNTWKPTSGMTGGGIMGMM